MEINMTQLFASLSNLTWKAECLVQAEFKNFKKQPKITNIFSWMNDYQNLKLNSGLRQTDRASLIRQKVVAYLYWWSETTMILVITTSIKLAILKMSKTRSNETTIKENTAMMMWTKLVMIERRRRTSKKSSSADWIKKTERRLVWRKKMFLFCANFILVLLETLISSPYFEAQ